MKSKKSGREILYWIVKVGDKYLDIGIANRWMRREDAAKYAALHGGRVVAVVRKDKPLLDPKHWAEKGAAEERAAIVAWLRSGNPNSWAAADIERGDHHRTRNGSGPTSALTCTPEERATLDALAWVEADRTQRYFSYSPHRITGREWIASHGAVGGDGPTLSAAVASLRAKVGEM